MTYLIEPGIAALVHVTCDLFPERYGSRRTAFIYMAEGKPIERGIGDPIEFAALPKEVQASIEGHFQSVFSLPIKERISYLRNTEPWRIEA